MMVGHAFRSEIGKEGGGVGAEEMTSVSMHCAAIRSSEDLSQPRAAEKASFATKNVCLK